MNNKAYRFFVPPPTLNAKISLLKRNERKTLRTLIKMMPHGAAKARIKKNELQAIVGIPLHLAEHAIRRLRELWLLRCETQVRGTPTSEMDIDFGAPEYISLILQELSGRKVSVRNQPLIPPVYCHKWARQRITRGAVEQMLLRWAEAPGPLLPFSHFRESHWETFCLIRVRWPTPLDDDYVYVAPEWLWAAFFARKHCAEAMCKSQLEYVNGLSIRLAVDAARRAVDSIVPPKTPPPPPPSPIEVEATSPDQTDDGDESKQPLERDGKKFRSCKH